MKIFGVDTAIQWIRFESNGQEHIIAFKRNWWRGFTYFAYDGEEKIKILETCPAFLGKLKYIISNFITKKLFKDRRHVFINLQDKLKDMSLEK